MDTNLTLLTRSQLAARWRCSPLTIWRRMKTGALPFINLADVGAGKMQPRFRLNDIEAIEKRGTFSARTAD